MPQVGYGIRCYAIIFRRPALFNFAHCDDVLRLLDGGQCACQTSKAKLR
jgi:hypothetical protein